MGFLLHLLERLPHSHLSLKQGVWDSHGGPHPLPGGPTQPLGSVPGPEAAAEREECARSLPEGEGASHVAAATLRSKDTKQAFRAPSKAAQTTGPGAAPMFPP